RIRVKVNAADQRRPDFKLTLGLRGLLLLVDEDDFVVAALLFVHRLPAASRASSSVIVCHSDRNQHGSAASFALMSASNVFFS
ncbi:MAG TPA: hypothetical protein VFX94_09275, partial [Burkholderiales bacterium]|nr:hypothetical protein [Burkholderiales bacterium]